MKRLGVGGGGVIITCTVPGEVMEVFSLSALRVKLTANCGRLLNDERGRKGKHEIKYA